MKTTQLIPNIIPITVLSLISQTNKTFHFLYSIQFNFINILYLDVAHPLACRRGWSNNTFSSSFICLRKLPIGCGYYCCCRWLYIRVDRLYHFYWGFVLNDLLLHRPPSPTIKWRWVEIRNVRMCRINDVTLLHFN